MWEKESRRKGEGKRVEHGDHEDRFVRSFVPVEALADDTDVEAVNPFDGMVERSYP